MKAENRLTTYYKILFSFLAVNVCLFCPEAAQAITAPAVGDFGYDIYDVAVNDILQGPIGFVGGLACIVIGAVFAVKQQFMGAVPCILGGAVIIKGNTIVESLGALI